MSLRIKPEACGLPFHGLVTDGVLALPNNTTKPVSQPSPANVLLNTARTPGPSSSEDDAANGWSWKDRLMIPGVVGLGVDDVIFIDDANVPYLIHLDVTRPASKSVRVVATLVREYGILDDSHIDDFNVELFDTTFDLTPSGTTSLLSFKAPPDLIVNRVEQSPDGHGVFINLAGNYFDNGSSLVGIDKFTSAAILKVSISGEFSQFALSGVTGSLSVHKTVDECVGEYTSTQVQSPVYKLYDWQQTETLDGWVPGPGANDWFDALINMSSTFAMTETVTGNPSDTPTGTDELLLEQTIVQYAHYDNGGSEQTLSYRVTKTTTTAYQANFNFSMTPSTLSWSYHCAHALGSNPGSFRCDIHAPASGTPATRNQYEDRSSTETRTYKVEQQINGGAVQEKTYEWKDVHTDIDDLEYISSDWPRDSVNGSPGSQRISADQNDEEAFWLYPDFDPDSIYSPTTKDSIYSLWDTTNHTFTDTHVYTSTEWGEVLYSGDTAPTDQGFDNFDFGLIGYRFLGMENTRTNTKAAAQSAYGASQADHANNIAYDPYTDTITDSDDPVGYI